MSAATALAGPWGEAETRSQTSRIRAQFSEVRFSSVALAEDLSEGGHELAPGWVVLGRLWGDGG